MRKYLNDQGTVSILLIAAAIGVIAFLLVSSTALFKNNIFQALFPKPGSFASGPISNPVSNPVSPTPTPSTTFNFTMNGASNVPPVTTNGIGSGTLVLSANQTSATLTMSYANLTSPANLAHIHGPATTTQAAGIIFPLNINASTSGSNLVTNINGLTAQQVADLKNGLWYVNVHTNNFPGGEIRGQILATPSPSASPIPGDIDGNGKVDIFDYNFMLTDFGKVGSGIGSDLDGNGKVDIFDYNILLTNFGRTG
jgi:hypothetical protein